MTASWFIRRTDREGLFSNYGAWPSPATAMTRGRPVLVNSEVLQRGAAAPADGRTPASPFAGLKSAPRSCGVRLSRTSLQLRRARGENFKRKTIRGDTAAGDGKIEVFGNLVVFRQQRKIHPATEDFSRRDHRQGAERRGVGGGRAAGGIVFQGGKSHAHDFTLVLVVEQAVARAANALGGVGKAGDFTQRPVLAVGASQIGLNHRNVRRQGDITAAGRAIKRTWRGGARRQGNRVNGPTGKLPGWGRVFL